MKTTFRSVLSATIALGLAAFTIFSALAAGLPASVTAAAFGLLAVYGLLEMMLLSYAVRPAVVRSAARRTTAAQPVIVRVPALVEYPVGPARRCAA